MPRVAFIDTRSICTGITTNSMLVYGWKMTCLTMYNLKVELKINDDDDDDDSQIDVVPYNENRNMPANLQAACGSDSYGSCEYEYYLTMKVENGMTLDDAEALYDVSVREFADKLELTSPPKLHALVDIY